MMRKEGICWVWEAWVVESPGEEDVSEQGELGESWNQENQGVLLGKQRATEARRPRRYWTLMPGVGLMKTFLCMSYRPFPKPRVLSFFPGTR